MLSAWAEQAEDTQASGVSHAVFFKLALLGENEKLIHFPKA